MASFEKCLAFVLEAEGGLSEHPLDLGGTTKYGITLNTLKAFRLDERLKAIDIKTLGMAEAGLIYKDKYWHPLGLDLIQSEPLATAIFDQAVNRGVGSVTRQLQHLLNTHPGVKLKCDAIMGQKTIDALNSVDAHIFGLEFICLAQDSYAVIAEKNPTQTCFLRGWLHRTQELFKLFLKSPPKDLS